MTNQKKHKILKRLFYLRKDVSGLVISFRAKTGKILHARKGSKISRLFRYAFEHAKIKQFLGANLAFIFIATTIIPRQTSVSAADAGNIRLNQESTEFSTKPGIQYPVPFVQINQGYSFFHRGIDLGGYTGLEIKPFSAGTVIAAGYTRDGYGNNVIIDHGNGLSSLYAHLSKITVTVGENVTVDTKLGEMGATGHATGPHLHFEVRQDGVQMNPFDYLPR